MTDPGQPGSWRRVRWFAWQTGIPLVILFAIIGVAQIVWEVINHG